MWDRLDLSDDDELDCHPNIEKNTWKRLMAQKRAERRAQEEEKIEQLKKKIAKHESKAADLQAKLDGEVDMDAGERAQLRVDIEEARASVASYQAKLDKFLATRKLVADDLAHTAEDRSVVNPRAGEVAPLPAQEVIRKEAGETGAEVVGGGEAAPASASAPVPAPKKKKSPSGPLPPGAAQAKSTAAASGAPEESELSYDVYIAHFKDQLHKYSSLRSDEETQEYLLQHHELLDAHADGYMLLQVLDLFMKHVAENEQDERDEAERARKFAAGELQESKEEFEKQQALRKKQRAKKLKRQQDQQYHLGRQRLILSYILQLSDGTRVDVRDAIRPFFAKVSGRGTQQVAGFEEDLRADLKRIEERARVKLAAGEKSPFQSFSRLENPDEDDEEEYELAGVRFIVVPPPPPPRCPEMNEMVRFSPRQRRLSLARNTARARGSGPHRSAQLPAAGASGCLYRPGHGQAEARAHESAPRGGSNAHGPLHREWTLGGQWRRVARSAPFIDNV